MTDSESQTSYQADHVATNWSLPSTLQSLLASPFQQTIDQLIPPPSAAPPTPPAPTVAHDAPFLKAMKKGPDGRTENGALAFLSTESPLVDLFYELTPGVGAERLWQLLETAWKEDPTS